MGNLFNVDNAFFSTVSKIVDMIILSMVWLICCIPIVTVVPATTALYYATVKVIRRERGYLIREYFHSFKINFKYGALSSIVSILAIFIMYINRKWAQTVPGTSGFLLVALYNSIFFLIVLTLIYLPPVLSRFKTSFFGLFRMSIFCATKYLPTTIVLVITIAAFAFITYVLWIAILITPALCCLLVSFLMERVFKKNMPERSEESQGEYATKDEWYLE